MALAGGAMGLWNARKAADRAKKETWRQLPQPTTKERD